MTEEKEIPKKSYYQRNKDKYKKGGKYYYYKSVEDRRPIYPVSIKTGEFTLTFD
jgi:hypothetical protein|tara:strand:- start:119 stop:280 length:162 start_codon:yes stop_codon:yes gene_type:complete